MEILIADVCVSVTVNEMEGVFASEMRLSEPFFDFIESHLGPIEFLAFCYFCLSIHDGEEGFIVNYLIFAFIHVIEEIVFLILGK